MELADIRRDYRLKEMDENQISRNPMELFEMWLNEAFDAKANEPTAMVLATATPGGDPAARIVLLKAFSPAGIPSAGFLLSNSSILSSSSSPPT